MLTVFASSEAPVVLVGFRHPGTFRGLVRAPPDRPGRAPVSRRSSCICIRQGRSALDLNLGGRRADTDSSRAQGAGRRAQEEAPSSAT